MEELVKNQYIRVTKEHIVLPDGKSLGEYFMVERKSFVVVVPLVDEGVVLVRQYRPAAGKYIWNLPMGFIDARETPEETAARELKEETGFAARFEKIGEVMPAASFMRQTCHIFIARDCIKESEKIDEEIDAQAIFSMDAVLKDIREGRIIDMTSVAAILLAREKTR